MENKNVKLKYAFGTFKDYAGLLLGFVILCIFFHCSDTDILKEYKHYECPEADFYKRHHGVRNDIRATTGRNRFVYGFYGIFCVHT